MEKNQEGIPKNLNVDEACKYEIADRIQAIKVVPQRAAERHPANAQQRHPRQVGDQPRMAIRLSKAFGSPPETWLRIQLAYDLAQAQKDESKI